MSVRKTVLSGDIGGTNTRFNLLDYTNGAKNVQLLYSKRYQNEKFETFLAVLTTFLNEANALSAAELPKSACFACAGPVANNSVKFTNRDTWSVDGDLVAKELGIKKVKLINDFVAVGYGLLTLDLDSETVCLQKGLRREGAPIACIGAGTGLGECFLTPNADGNYECFPSEGGHVEFSPSNDLEIGLQAYLKRKFNEQRRVSVERVVSGTGLVNVYEYLCITYPELVDPHIHDKIEKAGDLKGAVIAQNQQNEICAKTMELFFIAYGMAAGSAAVTWLPFSGLFVTGGLTPKNMNVLKDPKGPFYTAYLDKGRLSSFISNIPIYLVKVEDLGERGAQYVAAKLLMDVNLEEEHKNISSIPVISTEKNNLLSSLSVISLNIGLLLGLGIAFAFTQLKSKKWK